MAHASASQAGLIPGATPTTIATEWTATMGLVVPIVSMRGSPVIASGDTRENTVKSTTNVGRCPATLTEATVSMEPAIVTEVFRAKLVTMKTTASMLTAKMVALAEIRLVATEAAIGDAIVRMDTTDLIVATMMPVILSPVRVMAVSVSTAPANVIRVTVEVIAVIRIIAMGLPAKMAAPVSMCQRQLLLSAIVSTDTLGTPVKISTIATTSLATLDIATQPLETASAIRAGQDRSAMFRTCATACIVATAALVATVLATAPQVILVRAATTTTRVIASAAMAADIATAGPAAVTMATLATSARSLTTAST